MVLHPGRRWLLQNSEDHPGHKDPVQEQNSRHHDVGSSYRWDFNIPEGKAMTPLGNSGIHENKRAAHWCRRRGATINDTATHAARFDKADVREHVLGLIIAVQKFKGCGHVAGSRVSSGHLFDPRKVLRMCHMLPYRSNMQNPMQQPDEAGRRPEISESNDQGLRTLI